MKAFLLKKDREEYVSVWIVWRSMLNKQGNTLFKGLNRVQNPRKKMHACTNPLDG